MNSEVMAARQSTLQRRMLLYSITRQYEKEGMELADTMEEFKREFRRDFLAELSPEERRQALQGLSCAQWQEALRNMSLEQLREILQGLPMERLRELFVRLLAADLSEQERPRRRGRGTPRR